MRNQKSFSLEFKRRVVEELMSGESRPAQLCRRYNSTTLIWTETAKEGYELIVLDLSIKNVLIEPKLTINPLYMLLVDTESKAYGNVALTIALEGLLRLTDISPAEETRGRLLFSVPAGITLDRVMYKLGTLGPPFQVSFR